MSRRQWKAEPSQVAIEEQETFLSVRCSTKFWSSCKWRQSLVVITPFPLAMIDNKNSLDVNSANIEYMITIKY